MQESPYLNNHEYLIDKFKKIPFLSSLNKKYFKKILTLSRIRKYDPDEIITREDQYDRWLYFIISGEVKVIKHGNEIARLKNVGDTFGEMALIDDKARSASVYAATDTVCLAINISFLNDLKPEDRSSYYSVFYRLLAEILADRLRSTNDELIRIKEELDQLKKAQNTA